MASLADGVYLVGARGEVRFANPAAVGDPRLRRRGSCSGRDSHATIHSHRPDGTPFPEEECPLLRPRVTGETVRVELDWFIRADGTFVPVSYASAPIAPRARAVVVFRDVSDRLAAEEVAGSRARIVAATDAERRRIGRDLHDGAQQRLVHVLMGIEEARRDPARAPDALAGAAEDARRAIEELRDLAAGIHPLVLTDRGLAVALEELTARSPLPVALDVTEERFAAEVEAAAYFLVAEALTNAVKHAQRRGVVVIVARRRDACGSGRRRRPRRRRPVRSARACAGCRTASPCSAARSVDSPAGGHDAAGDVAARSSVRTASTRRLSERSCPRSSLLKIDVTCFSTAGARPSAAPRSPGSTALGHQPEHLALARRQSSSGSARRRRPSIRATTSGSSAVPPSATVRTASVK